MVDARVLHLEMILTTVPAPGRLLSLFSLAALLGALGCVDDGGGGGLYVFDESSRSVLVWKDADQVYQAAREDKDAPAPVRTIKGAVLKDISLGWGGMALDEGRNRLYLVSENGRVAVIRSPSTQNGAISGTGQITTFNLGASGDRFGSGSVFGQASVDTEKDILYVQENARNGDEARIWRVPKASAQPNGAIVPKDRALRTGNDRGAGGVAAGQGHRFYALFAGGDNFEDSHQEHITGARLREGTEAGFPASPAHNRPINTLVGPNTGLPGGFRHGSLAYDGKHQTLYALTLAGGDAAKPVVQVFGAGQFHGHHDQAPSQTLAGIPEDLRIIVHSRHSDWMLGAGRAAASGRGRDTLYLWKDPAAGGACLKARMPETRDIRGMAVAH